MFEDESDVSLLPSVRATWAPKGHTPVIEHQFNWKRLSVAGFIAYKPDLSDARFWFTLVSGSHNTLTLIDALTQLHEELGGGVTLVWDGLSAHRSAIMREHVCAQNWLTVERLPGYAPTLTLLRASGAPSKHTISRTSARAQSASLKQPLPPVYSASAQSPRCYSTPCAAPDRSNPLQPLRLFRACTSGSGIAVELQRSGAFTISDTGQGPADRPAATGDVLFPALASCPSATPARAQLSDRAVTWVTCVCSPVHAPGSAHCS